jgi:hypothetical protein
MKRFFFFLTIVALLIVGGHFSKNRNIEEDEPNVRGVMEEEDNLIKIALCPTWYHFEDVLREEFGSLLLVYKTFSTAESITLMNEGQVDYVLAGRPLYFNEGEYEYEIIGDGLAFIAKEALLIQEKDINEYEFVTSLDVNYVKKFVDLKNLEKKEFNTLEEGKIYVLDWNEVDIDEVELVIVESEKGGKARYSRRPTLYCKNTCLDVLIKILKQKDDCC